LKHPERVQNKLYNMLSREPTQKLKKTPSWASLSLDLWKLLSKWPELPDELRSFGPKNAWTLTSGYINKCWNIGPKVCWVANWLLKFDGILFFFSALGSIQGHKVQHLLVVT
jgi:hypothetical protein